MDFIIGNENESQTLSSSVKRHIKFHRGHDYYYLKKSSFMSVVKLWRIVKNFNVS